MYFFYVFSGTRPTKILGSACIFGKSLKPVVFSMKLGVLAETKSYTDSDVFLADSVNLLIARTFVLIAERFFNDGEAKKYSAKKRNAPLSGLHSAPQALRCIQMRFSIFPPIVEKTFSYSARKSELLSKIHTTQPKITSLYV